MVLAALSENNTFANPLFAYPNCVALLLTPTRFNNTANPPLGPARYAYKSPLNPPVMFRVTFTLLIAQLIPVRFVASAMPSMVASGTVTLFVKLNVYICPIAAPAHSTIPATIAFSGFLFMVVPQVSVQG